MYHSSKFLPEFCSFYHTVKDYQSLLRPSAFLGWEEKLLFLDIVIFLQ